MRGGPHEDAHRPALTDDEVRAVAALARQAGHHFGRPQDIEWAIEDGCLYLLQARPITALSEVVDPDGALCLWDNSNIAESYAGVTTPLTFSFARRAYEEVYRQFCRLMRVPAARIAAHDDIFPRMLGLIRGRVYYNLLSWYRVLALLPGYALNRGFMEQMMGVRERLPESLLPTGRTTAWRDRLMDGFACWSLSAGWSSTCAGCRVVSRTSTDDWMPRLPPPIRRSKRCAPTNSRRTTAISSDNSSPAGTRPWSMTSSP